MVNAYVQPLIERYLGRLESGLRQHGFAGDLYLMTSAGGAITAEAASQFPVLLLESGPAAGALMSQYAGKSIGAGDLLAFDMGGTTAKGCVIKGDALRKEYSIEVARSYNYKKGSGFPLMIPAVQLIEIRRGGGQYCHRRHAAQAARGARERRRRPGARLPTPVAALVPPSPTPTCCWAIWIPASSWGGEMRLDPDAAKRAIQQVAEPLGIDVTEAALGIHDVSNENIARAFRLHTAESGVDIAGHDLVAFGGAGPVHAVRVAKRLWVQRVVVPWGAGVFSAFGLLVTPLGFDVVQTALQPLGELTPEGMEQAFFRTGVQEQWSSSAKLVSPRRRSAWSAPWTSAIRDRPTPWRWPTTTWIRAMPWPTWSGALWPPTSRSTATAPAGAPMEVLNWKVAGAGPIKALDLRQARDGAAGGHDDNDALKGHRNLYIPAKGSFPALPYLRPLPPDAGRPGQRPRRGRGARVVAAAGSRRRRPGGRAAQHQDHARAGWRVGGRRVRPCTHMRGPAMLIADRRHQAHAEAFIVDRAAV